MSLNAITQASGALKPVPMFLNLPTVISRATLIGALPPISTELAEVFRRVDAVIGEGQIAYVTPTKSSENPYGAVIADQSGNVCAAAMGKTKEGLADLIRFQLKPTPEGLGEDS